MLLLAVLAAGCVPVTSSDSASLGEEAAQPADMKGEGMATIYLAGGCFWGLEKYVSLVNGVVATDVGYANGTTDSPTYKEVCTGRTGHAETVRVDYDPEVAPLAFLLELYYRAIDPLALNRQGNDVGTQYRTGIYYTDPADAPTIERSLAQLQEQHDRPVVVEAGPLVNFTSAEAYHQDYLEKNPGGYCHIGPGLLEVAASAVPDASHFAASER
jgi:peptide methionine sulfoxide reductase msrA/msrB